LENSEHRLQQIEQFDPGVTMTLQASHQQTTVNRGVTQVCAGRPTADGAGVRLTRVIGTPEISMLDPFLLLDIFESDNPADYIGGFPAHPHRGFETVTYMLAGRMGGAMDDGGQRHYSFGDAEATGRFAEGHTTLGQFTRAAEDAG
jgi:hypothetical protein